MEQINVWAIELCLKTGCGFIVKHDYNNEYYAYFADFSLTVTESNEPGKCVCEFTGITKQKTKPITPESAWEILKAFGYE